MTKNPSNSDLVVVWAAAVFLILVVLYVAAKQDQRIIDWSHSLDKRISTLEKAK